MTPSQVKQSSTLINKREPSGQDANIVTIRTTENFCNFITKPNINYNFDVYVSNCAGESNGTQAKGRCATDVAGVIVVNLLTSAGYRTVLLNMYSSQ